MKRWFSIPAVLVLFVLISAGAAAQQTLPPEVALGRDWLRAQIDVTGALSSTSIILATAEQSESEVVETLAYLDAPNAALVQRHSQRLSDGGVEHLSRQIIALSRARKPVTSQLAGLRALQNADGGFGGTSGRGSTITDTSFALTALRAAGVVDGPDLSRALNYLVGRLSNPGNRDWQTDTKSEPYVVAYGLLALQVHSSRFSLGAALNVQREALLGLQDQGRYGEVLLDAVAALALQYASTDLTSLDTLKAAIRSNQDPNGSWYGDSFLTALALRALSIGVVMPPETDSRFVLAVRDAESLALLPGVRLEIGELPDLELLSGTNGQIDSGILQPGVYSLRLSKIGYQSRDLNAMTLNAGQTRDLGTLALTRDPAFAVLSGRVTDVGTSSPIAGADVVVSGAQSSQTQTGPDGAYELRFASAGQVTIQVSSIGYRSVSTEGQLVAGENLRFSPALYPNGTVVPTEAAVSGQVVHALTGAPVSAASITIGTGVATSGSDGRFSMAGLPVGSFGASIQKQGFLDRQVRGLLGLGVNDLGVIRLQPATNQTFSSLEGRVLDAQTGSPLPSAVVAIVGTNTRAVTDAEGRYRIDNIAQLPFSAIATAAGYGSQTLTTDSVVHSSYRADFGLQRIVVSGLNVSLQGLVMSAPEFGPYSELGLRATVKNLSTDQTVPLVFNAIISAPNGNVVRDVPFVEMTLATDPTDAIIQFAPGESKDIVITWGNFADVAGDYTVRFRGVTPDGQVGVEGLTTYRNRAEAVLGGGFNLTPPILQAGTGTSVTIKASLVNTGNLPIPAGPARFEIKVAALDDRPPVPAKPTFSGDLTVGAPLSSPVGLAKDSSGTVYTVSTGSPNQLIRVSTAGVASVVRALPTTSNTAQSLGAAIWVSWRTPNLIKIATGNGWTYEVDLNNANTVGNFRAPPAGLSLVGFYEENTVTGAEYFAGNLNSRQQVIQRMPGGQTSTLIDTGMGDPIAAQFGPDGQLYLLNGSPCAVLRLDPQTRALGPYWNGLSPCDAMTIDAQGTVFISEGSSPRRILRKYTNGTTDVMTNLSPLVTSDLAIGNDGSLHGLFKDGTIRRITNAGTSAIVAQALMNQPTGVALDASGGLLVQGQKAITYLAPNGVASSLSAGASNLIDLTTDVVAGQALGIANNGGVFRYSQAAPVTLVAVSAGEYLSIARNGSKIWLAGEVDSRMSLLTVPTSGGTPTIRYQSPFADSGVSLQSLPNGDVLVVNPQSLVRLRPDGIGQTIASLGGQIYSATVSRDGSALWANANTGFFRIDLATGNATRLRAFIGNMRDGIAEDASGGLVFGDDSLPKFHRYDPVTNSLADYAVPPPSGLTIRDATLATNGDLLAFLSDRTVRRYDDVAWTTVATLADRFIRSADGRAGYVKANSIFEIGATQATAPRTVATFPSNPLSPAWLDDTRFADFRVAASRLAYLTAAGAVTTTVDALLSVTDIAVTSDDTVVVLDNADYLHRFEANALTQATMYAGARRLAADGNAVYVSGDSGVVRVNANGTTSAFLTVPDWGAGRYDHFSVSGQHAVLAHLNSGDIVLFEDNQIKARYLPFNSPNAFQQMPNGHWMISNETLLVDFDPATQQSRLVESPGNPIVDMALSPDGKLHAITDELQVSRFETDGTATQVAGLTLITNEGLSALAIDPQGKIYGAAKSGIIYRADQGEFEYVSAGISALAGMDWHPEAGLLVAGGGGSDGAQGSVFQLVNDKLRFVMSVHDRLKSVCALDRDTFAVGGVKYLAIANAQGTFSLANSPSGRIANSMWCDSDGTILGADKATNAIFRANAGGQQVGPQIGDVVRSSILSLSGLATGASIELSLPDWVPQFGADYELTISPLDSSVSGSAASGIHVGPAASAVMSANRTHALPGSASVSVNTRIEGADFTHLSRVNRSMMQLIATSIGPDLMGVDPAGYFWFAGANNEGLYRKAPQNAATADTITANDLIGRGELPIDQAGRAYVVVRITETDPDPDVTRHLLRRYNTSGGFEELHDFGTTEIAGMAISDSGVLFVLAASNTIFKLPPGGAMLPFATVPGVGPRDFSIDGQGALYVRLLNGKLFRIDASGAIEEIDLRGATFENEGINIAGDCGDGVYVTPKAMSEFGQTGEEQTLVHVVGKTGQIGSILNGKTINEKLDDLDYMVYDRFASQMVIRAHLKTSPTGDELYALPVTCGAISLDLHILLDSNQSLERTDRAPSVIVEQANGEQELVWHLRDVGELGQDIGLETRLENLGRGSTRPVVKAAWLSINNSFQLEPVRLNIEVPTISVNDLVDVRVELDRANYGSQASVGIAATFTNQDEITKAAAIKIAVVDEAGAALATLVKRTATFGPLESTTLNPPFNTGDLPVGSYRVIASVLAADGEVVASDNKSFSILPGAGPVLSSIVTTDKAVYQVGDTAQVTSVVRNLRNNQALTQLDVTYRVMNAADVSVFEGSLPIANLPALAESRLSLQIGLQNWPAGSYRLTQEVRDAAHELLDSQSATFAVQGLSGTESLTGKLTLDTSQVRRGQPVSVTADLRNRGESTLNGVTGLVQVLHPRTGQVFWTDEVAFDIAAGQTASMTPVLQTADLSPQTYLVTLSARVGATTRILAQAPLTVGDVILSGTLSVTPDPVPRGGSVSIAAQISNTGTLSLIDGAVRLEVLEGINQGVVDAWPSAQTIAPGASINLNQVFPTTALTRGNYLVRLTVTENGQSRLLASQSFTVQEAQISGVFVASPAQVASGQSVSLSGTVSNTGNAASIALPLRIEVYRQDTQTLLQTYVDQAAVNPGTSFVMSRTFETSGLAAGDYRGTLSLQRNGIWQILAEDSFAVVQNIDVDLEMTLPRDPRVLVLLGCSSHQSRSIDVESGHPETVCEFQNEQFLSAYLAARGIEHKIVLDQETFMNELRCGYYNTYWLSGGAVKLKTAETLELRESIFRGDGLIIEGDSDQRNSQLDEMLGHKFRGSHSSENLPLTGAGSTFPQVVTPSFGRALKLELTTGRLEARFHTVNWPAIISSDYGQGRAMTYAFDLIESLRQQGHEPATERLVINGLLYVTPRTSPADYPVGGFVPVSTAVINQGAAVDLRLRTEVVKPTSIVSSSPLPTEGTTSASIWDFNLDGGATKSFDANVLIGGVGSTEVSSEVFERRGADLVSLSNVKGNLMGRDKTALSNNVIASLRAANLSGSERSARDKAVAAIESARTLATTRAISKWLDAVTEVRKISSVSNAEWRLSIDLLLAISQHESCSQALRLCGTNPATPQVIAAHDFGLLSTIGKVQAGSASSWEWQLAGRDSSAPGLRLNLDWAQGKPVDFVLTINSQGAGTLKLLQNGVVKGTVSSNPYIDGKLRFDDAVQFSAQASSDVGNARVLLRNVRLNDQAVSNLLQSATTGAFSDTTLSLFKPKTGQTFKLEGTVEMLFNGNTLPSGSRLQLVLRSGQLQCNCGDDD